MGIDGDIRTRKGLSSDPYDMLMRSRFYIAGTQVCDSYVSNLGILSILMYEGLNCVDCSPTVT